jgi:streptogramin lyase
MSSASLALLGAALLLAMTSGLQEARAQNVPCSVTYTLDADFDLGNLINVNHSSPNNNQLQLSEVTAPQPYIWVACSDRGTAVRIDVVTGAILGEYRTAPENRPSNPSRTTVDQYGNVWIGNRNEASGQGSVVKIGLVIGGTRCNSDGTPNATGEYLMPPFQYCTAEDRDGDGLIHTSLGLTNILDWDNLSGVDHEGGVETAEDECILLYVRTAGTGIRTIAVDANNDVWVGGYNNKIHQKLDGETGASLVTYNPGFGGYGGLIDGDGILWSANLDYGFLARIDVGANPITRNIIDVSSYYSYGLGIDTDGNIYNTTYTGNSVVKISPAGVVQNTWTTGGSSNDRGVALTPDGHIWVANSGNTSGTNVSHLSPTGTLLKTISVGVQPTGVAVDANGKIWVTDYQSDDVRRIDPNVDLGTVDLIVDLGPNAGPYNYSDMTGAVALGATTWTGSWSITQQGIDANTKWGTISWNASTPAGTQLKVEARSGGGPYQDITAYNGIPLCETGSSFTGLSLNVRVTFTGDPENNVSPVLQDLTIALCDDQSPVLDNDPLAVVTGECEATITEVPTATDYCDGTIYGETSDPLTYTEQGTFYVTWTFTDSKGNSVSQDQTVIVDDVTPPVLTLNSDVSVWPPNHAYTTFTVANMVSSVTDNCNTELTVGSVTINSVSSDEYENAVGNGDGNTVNDMVIALNCASVNVRKERCGDLNGRVYTVTLQVSDGNGNTTMEDFHIQVTHDMNGAPAIDDGIANGYSVTSACSGSQPKRIGHVSSGPEVCTLDQNYPNPFNPSTAIRYRIGEDDHVVLKVYDIYGREKATLVDAILTAGSYEVQFDGSMLTSGTYVYVLTGNGSTIKRTMSLMK